MFGGMWAGSWRPVVLDDWLRAEASSIVGESPVTKITQMSGHRLLPICWLFDPAPLAPRRLSSLFQSSLLCPAPPERSVDCTEPEAETETETEAEPEAEAETEVVQTIISEVAGSPARMTLKWHFAHYDQRSTPSANFAHEPCDECAIRSEDDCRIVCQGCCFCETGSLLCVVCLFRAEFTKSYPFPRTIDYPCILFQ